MKRLKRQFIKEYRICPTLVFPTPVNTVEHSMSRNIRIVLGNLFADDLKDLDKDFHANSVRKMWDTFFFKNKESLGSVFAAHLAQTGHSEATALRNYVVPDKLQMLQMLLDQLSLLEDATTPTKAVKKKPLSDLAQLGAPEVCYRTPSTAEAKAHRLVKMKTPCGASPHATNVKTPNDGTPHPTNVETPNDGTPYAMNLKTPNTHGPDLAATPCPPKPDCVKRPRRVQVKRNKVRLESEEVSDNNNSSPDYAPPSEEENDYEENADQGEPEPVKQTLRQRYIGSLKSYRKRQPSEQELQAVALFYYVKEPLTKKAIFAILNNSGIKLDGVQKKRIYDKVKYACNEYLKL